MTKEQILLLYHMLVEAAVMLHLTSLKVWNDTPSTIRELPTSNRLKQGLKTPLKG